ncbi:phage holin family protein [Cellulomonas sp. URHB0016]
MSTQSTPPAGGRSVGELVSELSEQVTRLVKAELDLAKAEISGRAQQLGIGAGLLVAAGVLSLYLLAAAIATVILALCTVWDPWLAALVVTVALLLVVVVLALIGIRRLKKGAPPTPARAIENVHQDIDAVKAGISS